RLLPLGLSTLARGGLAADDGQHALAQLRGRLELLDGLTEEPHRRHQGLELPGAARAAWCVRPDRALLAGLEGAEREGDEVVPLGGVAVHQPSARVALILSIPSLIRPLIVPRGSLSISAISEWLDPP